MATKASVIELNGKVYDLIGSPVKTHTQTKPTATAVPKPITITVGKVMDGFTRRRNSTHATAPSTPKKTQRSKTLMRTVVNKPTPKHDIQPTALVKSSVTNPHRLARASKISKSRLVSRFGISHDRSFAPQIMPLPVQPAPEPEIDTPILTHEPVLIASPPHNHSHGHSQGLEQALTKADSHKQARLPKKPLSHRTAHKLHTSPRVIKAVASLVSILLIGGFFLYQNIPRLAMRVAATKAGISAKLPGYQPSGFALGERITYSPGQILLSYKSNSDERHFTLTQTATKLTPETLLSKDIAVNGQSYQTYQDADKTIYIDENNNATWIDDGVRYQIESNASLSSDQLLRIASSL